MEITRENGYDEGFWGDERIKMEMVRLHRAAVLAEDGDDDDLDAEMLLDAEEHAEAEKRFAERKQGGWVGMPTKGADSPLPAYTRFDHPGRLGYPGSRGGGSR